MNGIRLFQATDPYTVAKFHGIVVNLLLRNWELDYMRNRATFFPSGMPYNAAYG